jgi:hypothetical protein
MPICSHFAIVRTLLRLRPLNTKHIDKNDTKDNGHNKRGNDLKEERLRIKPTSIVMSSYDANGGGRDAPMRARVSGSVSLSPNDTPSARSPLPLFLLSLSLSVLPLSLSLHT